MAHLIRGFRKKPARRPEFSGGDEGPGGDGGGLGEASVRANPDDIDAHVARARGLLAAEEVQRKARRPVARALVEDGESLEHLQVQAHTSYDPTKEHLDSQAL